MEIERKFLVEEPPEWLDHHPATELRQGYVAITDGTEVRLRQRNGERLLTVKRGHGEVRREEEIEISPEQFDALWPLTETLRVQKCRYLVPLETAGVTAEVDLFESDLRGLVVAEVEFPSEQESAEFEPPAWFGAEVTGDERYTTAALARDGFPKGE